MTMKIMLMMMQVLFGYLLVSEKLFYDTTPFCESFLDLDGNPISASEQVRHC